MTASRADWLSAILFLFATFAATAALALVPPAGSLRHVAVFPPGWSPERSFAAAAASDVAILSPGRFANLVLVSAPDDAARAALHRQGALVVLDASAFEACLARLAASNPFRTE